MAKINAKGKEYIYPCACGKAALWKSSVIEKHPEKHAKKKNSECNGQPTAIFLFTFSELLLRIQPI